MNINEANLIKSAQFDQSLKKGWLIKLSF